MRNYLFRILITGILFSLPATSVTAQTFLLHSIPTKKLDLSLRYLRPNYNADLELSTLSGIYEFSANIPQKENRNFICSVPYQTISFNKYGYSSKALGNIYLGYQWHSGFENEKISVTSAGIFLPTSGKGGSGGLINFYEHYKYFSEAITIYAN